MMEWVRRVIRRAAGIDDVTDHLSDILGVLEGIETTLNEIRDQGD
jgi:hypothetical protein